MSSSRGGAQTQQSGFDAAVGSAVRGAMQNPAVQQAAIQQMQNPAVQQAAFQGAMGSAGGFAHGTGQSGGYQGGPRPATADEGGALLPKDGKRRQFLFCIPLQVGPSTAYARSIHHWIITILIVQFVVSVLRTLCIHDIIGGLWMLLTVFLGVHAWRENLNVTYICVWGMACFVNGCMDIVSAVLPLAIGILTLDVAGNVIRCCCPLAYLLGASFAWHIYRDYASREGLQNKYADKVGDPFGHYVERLDQESRQSADGGQQQAQRGYDAGQPSAISLNQQAQGHFTNAQAAATPYAQSAQQQAKQGYDAAQQNASSLHQQARGQFTNAQGQGGTSSRQVMDAQRREEPPSTMSSAQVRSSPFLN